MKHTIRSLLAWVLIIMIVLGIAAYIFVPHVAAESSDSLQSELNDLQSQREKLEKELNTIENKKDSELEKKAIIDQQINSLQSEISIANEQLDVINAELDAVNSQLEEASRLYSETFEQAKDYIRVAYESGTVSYLQIILSSGSITELITRVEIVKEIMAQHNAVISELAESKKTIESSQKKILEQQQAQQQVTSSLESKESTLEAKRSASNSLVAKFEDESDELSAQIEEVERLEAELQQQIAQLLKSEGNGSMDIPVSNGWRYPLDSNWRTITSPFGYRTHPKTGVYKLHSGVDISGSGINGASIYAAKNGSVSKAGYHTAYGNYCLINHGDGTASLYAHMSALLVSAGDVVTQGQVIGRVGSTGYSTGAHLHFEILINGEYVNPVPYFSSAVNFIYS